MGAQNILHTLAKVFSVVPENLYISLTEGIEGGGGHKDQKGLR